MTKPNILISAGEPSGEMYAARLVRALGKRVEAHLFGLGGPRMREAGVELVAENSAIAVVGITEVLGKAPTVWRLIRQLSEEAERRRPKLAILVDSPGFNLRLARRLAAQGVPIVYFISPHVWAWKRWRIHAIRNRVKRMLCIFPFEEKYYRDRGVAADFVGHPQVDEVRATRSRAEFAARYDMDPARPIVVLLPGSRRNELRYNLPTMLEACRLIAAKQPAQFVLALAPALRPEEVVPFAQADMPMHMVEDETYNALANADAAIVSSGTATVEAALLGTPMVVVYRLAPTTAFLLRRLVRTPFFSMVNLIAGRRVVTELFQDEFTAERVAGEVLRLLGSGEAREEMRRGLAEVRAKLGPGGAMERAAEIIAAML